MKIPYTKEEVAKLAWNAAQDNRWSEEMPADLGIKETIDNMETWKRNYMLSQCFKGKKQENQ